MQGTALQDLEVDMGSLREELQRLNQVDAIDWTVVVQRLASYNTKWNPPCRIVIKLIKCYNACYIW